MVYRTSVLPHSRGLIRHFDAHAYRSEDLEGVKAFARGNMRSYLILKDKAARWNADPEIGQLLAARKTVAETALVYSAEHAGRLKRARFDRDALSATGAGYERLDQLTFDVLMGAR